MAPDSAADTLERLVRVETKIDLLFTQGPSSLTSIGDRVTRLERFMWLMLGFVAANGVVNTAQLLGLIKA